MPKWLIVFLIVLAVLAALVVLVYWKFWGITKKQKYDRCAKSCEDMMLLTSDIPVCKTKCESITGYSPSTDTSSSKSGSSSSSKTTTSSSSTAYDCNYVWPQEIIEKATSKLVKACPYARPWCRPGAGNYEDISCCANYSETTKEKTNCVKLPELLESE